MFFKWSFKKRKNPQEYNTQNFSVFSPASLVKRNEMELVEHFFYWELGWEIYIFVSFLWAVALEGKLSRKLLVQSFMWENLIWVPNRIRLASVWHFCPRVVFKQFPPFLSVKFGTQLHTLPYDEWRGINKGHFLA